MSKMFKENGFLSEEGKKILQPLCNEMMELLSSHEVSTMSIQELQVLKANLSKIVGDTMSVVILNRKDDESLCTGFAWRDEYGNESFTHDEYNFCPVHDK